MSRVPLRWLLLGSVLGAIAIAFTAFAVYLDSVERANRMADIDSELVRAERALEVRPVPGRGQPPPRDAEAAAALEENEEQLLASPPIRVLLDDNSDVIQSSVETLPFEIGALDGLELVSGPTTLAEDRFRVRVSETPNGSVSVTALSLEEYDAAATRFRTTLAAGGGVILAVVAVVLWVLTAFLARPVTRMADVANRIASGELDQPVGEPSGARETAELAVDLERMLDRLRAALAEANGSRQRTERLLADMAHEIRTPLTALKGYSDLYAKGMLAEVEDVDRAMTRIGSESQRLTDLANGMLRLARHDSEPAEMCHVEISPLIEGVADDLRAAYPHHDLQVELSGSDHWVIGEAGRLQQAFLNLTSNAFHHSPPGAAVKLLVDRDDTDVVVRVVDRGPGVSAEDRDEIFSPFFRADTARHRSGQSGAGLGLSLVRQIVEDHHGTVDLEETSGGGATFLVTLPGVPAV